MDIRKLELFSDIAETHNLTETGNRMGYTQSGVSHLIKKLEDDMGFPLFKRTNKGVMLTANGAIMLPYVRSLIAQYNCMQEIRDSLNGLQIGYITIGSYSSIAIHWLPKIIKKFQNDYPNITIKLKEGGHDEIQEWIEDGTVDFGFISKNPAQKFEWITLQEDPLLAVLPRSYEITPRDSMAFSIDNFRHLPFILSETGTDYDICATLNAQNIQPNVRFSCKDDHSIISMVAQELGVSILPSLMLTGHFNEILTLPLKPYACRTLGIGVLSMQNLTAASRAFINCTKFMVEGSLQDKGRSCIL